MTIHTSLIFLLLTIVVLLLRKGLVSPAACITCTLLGFYLANTGIGVPTYAATDSFLTYVNRFSA